MLGTGIVPDENGRYVSSVWHAVDEFLTKFRPPQPYMKIEEVVPDVCPAPPDGTVALMPRVLPVTALTIVKLCGGRCSLSSGGTTRH